MDIETFADGMDITPESHFVPLAGNAADDDGRAIDDMFEAAPSGPLVFGDAQWTNPDLPQTTRLISRSITLTSGADPVMLFGPDPNRRSVTLYANFSLANDTLRIASEKTDVYGSALLRPNAIDNDVEATRIGKICFDNHTGAVWVFYPNAGTVNIDGWCITS